MNLEKIKQNYSQMETYQLVKLIDELDTLREDVIPILKEELENRKEHEYVGQIENKLAVKEEEENLRFEDRVDIDAYVSERLATGEAIESIIDDLKSKGVDLVSRTLDLTLKQESRIDEMMELAPSTGSDDYFKEKYAMNDDEVKILRDKIKLKSKNNIRLGLFLIIIPIALFIILGFRNIKVTGFLSVGLITGIGKLSTGLNQKNKL